MGLQTYQKIMLVYVNSGLTVEAFDHPQDVAEYAMRNLTEDELTTMQSLIRKRKRDLKAGREVMVGLMRRPEHR